VGLSFSRDHETEADSFSVKYLCKTNYNAAGAAGFFKKIAGQATPPEWISTHPSPNNRIKNIESKAAALGCTGKDTNKAKYDQIKLLLTKIAPPPVAPSTGSLPKNTSTSGNKTTDPMNKPAPAPSTGTGKKPSGTIEKPK
jgi:predicted Zn-dependent protease